MRLLSRTPRIAMGKRRKRSPRFIDVAIEAGVSPSTVDRVLNERRSASEKARRKVIAAALKLGAPRILPSAAHELIHIDVLLPDNRTPFFPQAARRAGERLSDPRQAGRRPPPRHARSRRDFARQVDRHAPAYRRRGLILAAPDTADVRKALRDVLDRGEAVVTVVSNVADVPGIAYFGIDNYRAGRTAGLVMGRFARRPGRVMFLSGRNDWAAHHERTAGCRDVLTNAFLPNPTRDASPFETFDDELRCYIAVTEALKCGLGLAGIYNSGAGSTGIKYCGSARIFWAERHLDNPRAVGRSSPVPSVRRLG